MRLVGLFDLATGVLDRRGDRSVSRSERNLCRNLCRKLWKHVRAGDTIVADSGFCCWFTLYLFGRKGVNVVMRNNGIRKPDPSPAMIRRELLVHIIGYNLLRALMMHGKASGDGAASFKGTIDRLNHWLPVMLSSNSTLVRRRLVTDLVEMVEISHRSRHKKTADEIIPKNP